MEEKLSRQEALDLLRRYNKEPFHIQHALTVEGVMDWYARELGYGDDAPFWSMVGLLHDIDFEQWPEEHCKKAPELLEAAGFSPEFIHAVCSHGYGLCSDGALLERLYAAAQPWSVSTVAQAAGVAACACRDWPERGREILRLQRPKLMEALGSLGCAVWEGQANYLLFRAPGVEDLKERLLEKCVLIRSCANYHGLGEDWYRVCVGQAEQNRRLLAALREVL